MTTETMNMTMMEENNKRKAEEMVEETMPIKAPKMEEAVETSDSTMVAPVETAAVEEPVEAQEVVEEEAAQEEEEEAAVEEVEAAEAKKEESEDEKEDDLKDDMTHLDTKNIIAGGRRTRGKVIDYKAFGSDDEEEEEEEEDVDDEEDDE